MKHFTLKYLLLAGLPLLAACNSNIDALHEVQPLQLCVSAGVSESRAVVDGCYLPDGAQVGLSLVDAEGNPYDGQDYSNVPYSVDGDGYNVQQTWSCTGAVTPSLSTTLGKAVAYYPYNPDVTDLSSIPIETASQTDYMYSGFYIGLSCVTNIACLSMKHALTVLNLELYDDISDFSSIVIESDMVGSHAILNAVNGALSDIKIAKDDNIICIEPIQTEFSLLDSNVTSIDVLVIPDISVTTGYIKVSVTKKDGGSYEYTQNIIQPLKQGARYLMYVYNNSVG